MQGSTESASHTCAFYLIAAREPLHKSPTHVLAHAFQVRNASRPMLQANLGLNLSTKKTRKREFLEQMQQVVPWRDLVALIAPCAPEGRKGRPPFPVEMGVVA